MKRNTVLLIAVCCVIIPPLYAINNIAYFKTNKMVANSIIVITQPGLSKPNLMSAKSNYSVQISTKIPEIGVEEWIVSGDLESILADLNQMPGVSAFPNFVIERPDMEEFISVTAADTASSIPNDNYLGEQWSLNNDGTFDYQAVPGADISAFKAWDITTGDSNVVVAVLDGGIDINHDDLADNIWINVAEIPDNSIDDDGNGFVDDIYGWNAVDNDNDILDGDGHGTHVAGTIGAVTNNDIGIAGVTQQVKIIAVKVFDDWGSSTMIGFIRGYYYLSTLLKQGVKIVAVNQSWGGIRLMSYPSMRTFVDLMTSFALEHHELGMIWVVAGGNDGLDIDTFPHYCVPNCIPSPNIINVGSTGSSDESSSFTNYSVKSIDIGAPGEMIISTFPGNGYAYGTGTSMATPHVTGVIALAKSIFPSEKSSALFVRVQATCDPIAEFETLWMNGGRLNAFHAVSPDSGFSTLKTNVETLYLTYSNYDSFSVQSVGFVNCTDNSVDVLDVSFTGEDLSAFSLYNPFSTSTVEHNGAYGIDIQFKADGTKNDYNANVVISTSGGSLTIPLVGELFNFSDISIDPESHDFGNVKYGDSLSTSFTINNDGSRELNYNIRTDILWVNEVASENLAMQTAYKKADSKSQKAPLDFSQMVTDNFKKISALLAGRQRKHIDLVSADTSGIGLRELWSDDLNDADSVAEDWIIFTDDVGDEWKLADIDTMSTVDNVFLAGDFELGYKNNTSTAAIPPIFDFSPLSQTNEKPKYLQFDYAGILETGYDYFIVGVFQGSDLLGLIFDSDFNAPNDGNVYTVSVDIEFLASKDNIEFWFAAFYDSTIVAGWGSMFDNVKIIAKEDPILFSDLNGTIPPNSAHQIDVTIKTNLLQEGEYSIYSSIYSNASNGNFYSWTQTVKSHEIHFNNTIGYLSINPSELKLGAFYRDQKINYSFDATNTGLVEVDYSTLIQIERSDSPNSLNTADFSSLVKHNDYSNTNSMESTLSMAERKKRAANHVTKKRSVDAFQKNNSDQKSISTLFNGVSGDSINLPYLEDFESSDDVPADWNVVDESFGMGTKWMVVNIGNADSTNHAICFGDIENQTYRNSSETYAITPGFDLTEIHDSMDVFLEFDYSCNITDMSDHFDIWIGVLDENPEVAPQYHLLASNQNMGIIDGDQDHSIAINLGNYRHNMVFIKFGVITSHFNNKGFVLFDNVSLYTTTKDIYLTPISGSVDPGSSEQLKLVVNMDNLKPGYYQLTTSLDYDYMYNASNFFRLGDQVATFTLLNNLPDAVNDTMSIVSGDNIRVNDLMDIALANDLDADNDEILVEKIFDPKYGSFKSTTSTSAVPTSAYDGLYYVAPLNYDGFDQFQYKISDGFDSSEGTVFIQVLAQPRFIPGMQQEYTFFEDDSLTLNTMLIAAGVGGMDKELFVWAESDSELLKIVPDKNNHQLNIKTTQADTWGQAAITLYVGHENDPLDQVDVTFVVLPVNDHPTAQFTYAADGNSVTFTDASHDEKDVGGSIVKWLWDFGDGTSSELQDPVHVYDGDGAYVVTLTVTDNGGLETSVVENIDITVSDVSIVRSTIPTEYQLVQNFPNPFNPNTTVTFMLPKVSDVSLILYDIQGRAVKTIVKDRLQPGEYKVDVDGEGLTSGVYFVRFIAGRYQRIQKISLIK